MSNVQDIRRKVLEDWPTDSPAYRLLEGLLGNLRPKALDYLTLPHLKKLSHLDLSLAEIERIAEYFTGERISLLEVHYQLLREDNSTEEIAPAQLYDALDDGELNDPASGKPVKNWQRYVILFYSGTERLRDALRELHGE